jgi:hypothetical protein
MMMKMFVCSFGMIISYIFGLVFSFNMWIAPLAFGIFSAIAYYIVRYFNLKPPGSFFFIMMASMAIGLPHQSGSYSAENRRFHHWDFECLSYLLDLYFIKIQKRT